MIYLLLASSVLVQALKVSKGVWQSNLELTQPYYVYQGLSEDQCEMVLHAGKDLMAAFIDINGNCQFSALADTQPAGPNIGKVLIKEPIPDQYLKNYSFPHEVTVGPINEFAATEAECVAVLARTFKSGGSRFYDYSPPPTDDNPAPAHYCRAQEWLASPSYHKPKEFFKVGMLPEPRQFALGVQLSPLGTNVIAEIPGYGPEGCADVCGLFFQTYYFLSWTSTNYCVCFNQADVLTHASDVVTGSTGGIFYPGGINRVSYIGDSTIIRAADMESCSLGCQLTPGYSDWNWNKKTCSWYEEGAISDIQLIDDNYSGRVLQYRNTFFPGVSPECTDSDNPNECLVMVTDTALDCGFFCRYVDECNFWGFNAISLECILMTHITNAEVDETVTAGIKVSDASAGIEFETATTLDTSNRILFPNIPTERDCSVLCRWRTECSVAHYDQATGDCLLYEYIDWDEVNLSQNMQSISLTKMPSRTKLLYSGWGPTGTNPVFSQKTANVRECEILGSIWGVDVVKFDSGPTCIGFNKGGLTFEYNSTTQWIYKPHHYTEYYLDNITIDMEEVPNVDMFNSTKIECNAVCRHLPGCTIWVFDEQREICTLGASVQNVTNVDAVSTDYVGIQGHEFYTFDTLSISGTPLIPHRNIHTSTLNADPAIICAEACTNTAECRIFDYNSVDMTCSLYDRHTASDGTGHIVGVPAYRPYQLVNRKISGSKTMQWYQASDAYTCRDACASDINCNFYGWMEEYNQKQCFTYHWINFAEDNNDWWSGEVPLTTTSTTTPPTTPPPSTTQTTEEPTSEEVTVPTSTFLTLPGSTTATITIPGTQTVDPDGPFGPLMTTTTKGPATENTEEVEGSGEMSTAMVLVIICGTSLTVAVFAVVTSLVFLSANRRRKRKHERSMTNPQAMTGP